MLSKKMSYPDLASVGNSDPVSEQKSNISIVGSLDSPFDHQVASDAAAVHERQRGMPCSSRL